MIIDCSTWSKEKRELAELIRRLNDEQVDELLDYMSVDYAANEEQRAELESRRLTDGSDEFLKYVQKLAKTISPYEINATMKLVGQSKFKSRAFKKQKEMLAHIREGYRFKMKHHASEYDECYAGRG